MDMDLACLGEPIGCSVYSGMQSRVQLGCTVAVFGMGFAGQIMAKVVRKKVAYRVVAVGVVEEELKMARKLGADVTIISLREDPVETILDLTGGMVLIWPWKWRAPRKRSTNGPLRCVTTAQCF
jgi:threonine dehydrogenase-like Zn-dependent dehydrogenase